MPLSEHEQRQLEAIERALYADDPKFASAVRFSDPKVHGRRRLAAGVGLVVVGLVVLLLGAISSLLYVGVAGFLVMLVGGMRAAGAVRRLTSGLERPAASAKGATGRLRAWPSSVRERFEERWHRRFDQGS